MSHHGWLVISTTLPAAWLVCTLLPFVGHILQVFSTLCHEMGHALGGFSVGRISLPAFDFTYGGGFTSHGERQWWLLLLYLVGAVTLWIRPSEQRWLRWVVAAAVVGVTGLLLTDLDIAWFCWMGYGGELIIATVFLHRALTGVAEVYPGERWLYGLVGWALLGNALGLCWSLLFDPAFQQTYLAGKRGIDNDFVRLAQDHLGVSLHAVAWLNLLVGLLVPVCAVMAARWWPRTGGLSRQRV